MIRAVVYKSINDVDPVVWDSLLGDRSIAFSHAYWKITEESRLNDFSYRYALFIDCDDQPVGFSVFYVVTTDVAIFSPPRLRRCLEVIRHIFPSFLKLKMLECGTPMTINSPPVVLHSTVRVEDVIDALHDILKEYAQRERVFLIILRDFESSQREWQGRLIEKGYHWIKALPNTYLDIRWQSIKQYHGSLKSYYRSKINNHLRKNAEQGVRHDLLENFADLADDLCRQWLIVHERANEFQREILNPDFYRNLALSLSGSAKILRFFKGEKFIGHALLLHDRDTLRWLYFGRSEPLNDSLYLYVVQAVIETGINLKVKSIEMGLTTYSVKLDVGARPESIHFAIRCAFSIFNPLVGWCYKLLNKPANVQSKEVFKSETGKDLL